MLSVQMKVASNGRTYVLCDGQTDGQLCCSNTSACIRYRSGNKSKLECENVILIPYLLLYFGHQLYRNFRRGTNNSYAGRDVTNRSTAADTRLHETRC